MERLSFEVGMTFEGVAMWKLGWIFDENFLQASICRRRAVGRTSRSWMVLVGMIFSHTILLPHENGFDVIEEIESFLHVEIKKID